MANCIYEPGEPLLAGVTVQLLNAQNQVVSTTVTDQNGEYEFTGLRPSTYTVHEVQPVGYFEFGRQCWVGRWHARRDRHHHQCHARFRHERHGL